jgi:hypothetical protein
MVYGLSTKLEIYTYARTHTHRLHFRISCFFFYETSPVNIWAAASISGLTRALHKLFYRIQQMVQGLSWNVDSLVSRSGHFLHLWNPKSYRLIHKNPYPILSQTYPVHIFIICFSKVHFNMFLHSTSKPPKWPFPRDFATYFSFPRVCYITN